MKPMWLDVLLAEKFFTGCSKHNVWKKNEKNVFCLDCTISICQHCLFDHDSHQLLQIRRYVYHDVIRLDDIQKLLDCSRVQAYTINGARVVFLKERPQPKSNKGLGGNCESCERCLQDAYKFCSVACKVDMSFPARRGGQTASRPTSTTTHRSASSQSTKPASIAKANDDDTTDALLDQSRRNSDHTASTTTSSESIKSMGSSSLSNPGCNLNMRSLMSLATANSITANTSTTINKCHHLSESALIAPPQSPSPIIHSLNCGFQSLKRARSSCHSSSFGLLSPSLSRRRKCNKPHRSPFT